MNIELKTITIRELVEGYVDDGEQGVRGYGGKLNIRPAYQRDFSGAAPRPAFHHRCRPVTASVRPTTGRRSPPNA